MNPESHMKTWLIIAVAVVLALGGGAYWYYVARHKASAPAATTAQPPAGQPINQASLGAEVYSKSQNPVAGKLPEATAPVPNPINNAYKNPFQ